MASPLLNNLQNANLNAPISNLVGATGEAQPESLFMKLTAQLSLTDMLAMMQGNFGAISGLH